jgi:hypothetical protein
MSEIVKRELVWPPQSTSDLMAYFTELENNTIGFEGVSDRASELVRAMFGLAKLTGTEIQMKGNKSVDLLHSPSGG